VENTLCVLWLCRAFKNIMVYVAKPMSLGEVDVSTYNKICVYGVDTYVGDGKCARCAESLWWMSYVLPTAAAC